MVMAQTLFMLLKRLYSSCVIDVLAPDWTRPLLDRMPEVRRGVTMAVGHGELKLGARRRLGGELAQENYDLAIVLPNSFKSALVPWFARIPRRVGWRGEARGWLLNDCRKLDKVHYPRMVERFAALAYPPGAGLPRPLPSPALSTLNSRETLSRKFSLDAVKPALGLCPGAEFGGSKRWPPEYFASLVQKAAGEGYQSWLLGSEKDSETAKAVLAALPVSVKRACRDFTGATTLGDAVDLLAMTSAVLSNDSGLMHVAAALNKPMLVLYGSTTPDFTPPLSEKAKCLTLKLECSPCFARECPLGHHRCMRDLRPESVWRETRQLLELETETL